jgi:cell pole-organizing protein PopZ
MTSATAKSSEPTIDDILASIRRIIADDQQADQSAAPARTAPQSGDADLADAADDVLDLAQPVHRASPPAPRPAPVAAAAVNEAVVAALRPRPNEPEPVLPTKPGLASLKPAQAAPSPITPAPMASQPEAAAPEAPAPQSDGARLQKLIAGEAEEALSAAFGRISALKIATETKTLEGLVADLLRPILKEWCDANLPAIAERLIKQEIERISAQSHRST